MLDIKLIREQAGEVARRLATRRGGDESKLKEVLHLDEQRRGLLAEVEKLKATRNDVSKLIGALLKDRKQEEAEARKAEMRDIGDRITALDWEVQSTQASLDALMLQLPNLPHPSVAVGESAEDNPVVRSWGTRREYAFAPKTHIELCESLGLVDFARATKLTGSGFLLYTGWGARLERALIQFMLDLHTREHGYTEVSPPFMVKEECMIGVGQFPKFRDQAYGVAPGDVAGELGQWYLVPTAEAPVANIHREEILRADQLPIRYCAYTPCFRAEAGAAGVGSRGMIRVHQFDKVELIQIVPPEAGYEALETLVGHAEAVLQRLGLHYRVIQLCTADMGYASAMTYDIEVWAPGQGQFLEVSSCSNCEDFQARRMHLRVKDEAGRRFLPHILNGSGTALARLFVAIIETGQQADGSVLLPEALRAYMQTDRLVPAQAGKGTDGSS